MEEWWIDQRFKRAGEIEPEGPEIRKRKRKSFFVFLAYRLKKLLFLSRYKVMIGS